MPSIPRRSGLAATALAALLLASGLARAEFPDRPLRLVVGFPPGAGPDVVARTLGQKLGEVLKQSVVIDNRAGAGGQIGAQAVAKARPTATRCCSARSARSPSRQPHGANWPTTRRRNSPA